MSFSKGVAVTGFPFALLDADGQPVTSGTVTGYVLRDGGTQVALVGVPVHEGNGQWSVNLTATEMDGDEVGLLFVHANAIVHFTIKTEAPAITPAPVGVAISVLGATSYYGNLTRADQYFGERLNTRAWDTAILSDRTKALIMASRAIDRLNFAGEKAVSAQVLQFPRGIDTAVPQDVEFACYELAFAFLDGVDSEQEANSVGVASDAFSGVRTTYDGDSYAEHMRAGIPSIMAWEYLKPYLRDPREIALSRVN